MARREMPWVKTIAMAEKMLREQQGQRIDVSRRLLEELIRLAAENSPTGHA